MIVGKAIQSLQVKFTKNYLHRDNQSFLVTNILLPLYSLLSGLKGELALYGQHSGGRGLGTKRQSLLKNLLLPFILTQRSFYSQFQTALPSVHSLPFLQENPNSMLQAQVNFIRGNSKKTMYVIFSKAFDKILIYILTFIIQKHLLNTNYASILFQILGICESTKQSYSCEARVAQWLSVDV